MEVLLDEKNASMVCWSSSDVKEEAETKDEGPVMLHSALMYQASTCREL